MAHRMNHGRELSHFASSKVPAQAKFGTLERLKRDKSAGPRRGRRPIYIKGMRKFLLEKIHGVLRIMFDRASFRLDSSALSGIINYFDFR